MIRPRIMNARVPLVVALTVMVAATGSAQNRAADLAGAVVQLQRAVEGLPAKAKGPRLEQATGWLTRRSATANPADISPEYVRTLQRAAALLTERPTKDVIADVTAELEAKVDHCKKLGTGMGGSVLLQVSTRHGSRTVSDWQVFYLLKIYERVSAAAPVTFPTLSTPTETRLDPGRYWLWARDPTTGRTSERALVRVAGQTALRVDLPVP
jgi:hypothetical protein